MTKNHDFQCNEYQICALLMICKMSDKSDETIDYFEDDSDSSQISETTVEYFDENESMVQRLVIFSYILSFNSKKIFLINFL